MQPGASRVANVTSDSPGGNQTHTAPEVVAAMSGFASTVALPVGRVLSAVVDYSGQAVFEVGTLLHELAVGVHPLPGYPTGHVNGSRVSYSADIACVLTAERAAAVVAAGYPPAFLSLARRCVGPVAADRPSLADVLRDLACMFSDCQVAFIKQVRNVTELFFERCSCGQYPFRTGSS